MPRLAVRCVRPRPPRSGAQEPPRARIYVPHPHQDTGRLMQHGSHFGPPKETRTVKDWIEFRLPIFRLIDSVAGSYPTPRNLSYWWNFGSLAGICLVIQILTGVFLAMHYQPTAAGAFNSV